MSLDATRWAWMQMVGRSAAKLVLLSLADRAGEDHTSYPSLPRLHKDTELDIKTIRACLDHLMDLGLVARKADPGKVPIYRLIGFAGREDTPTKSGTPTKNGTPTKSGTPPLPKLVPLPLPKLVPEPINEPIKNQPREDNPLPPCSKPAPAKAPRPAVWTPPAEIDPTVWADFETHRREIRKPLTGLSRDKNAKVLVVLTQAQQRQCVDASIANHWTGLFPPKLNGATHATHREPTHDRCARINAEIEARARAHFQCVD